MAAIAAAACRLEYVASQNEASQLAIGLASAEDRYVYKNTLS